MIAGPRNSITDVSGVLVGNISDARIRTGVTTILFENPAVASVHVMGGAPGTRETDLLAPENTVDEIHGLVLTGGSAFGLDAAGGVQAVLRERGIGLRLVDQVVPLVPCAVIFDLPNGGDKAWPRYSPYRELGAVSAENAAADFEIGSHGGGYGALAGDLKGGLGSASAILSGDMAVGALVVANPVGAVTVGETRHFWAAPFEIGDEFGGMGYPDPFPADATGIRLKFGDRRRAGANTAIGAVATNARLTKTQAKRLAMVAHDGIARAIWPSHTPHDGDTLFAVSTGSGPEPSPEQWIELCAHAATVVARAIARAIFEAAPAEGDVLPAWREKFGL